MKIRPCIDIHDGKVKQIIGGSIQDSATGDFVKENFVSDQDSGEYARYFQSLGLRGGHVICLDQKEETIKQAQKALHAYPKGLQVGGGITPQNAHSFLEAGASHVIVTSYVFSEGYIHWEHLKELCSCVGKEHLVLDLSVRRTKDSYVVVTNRWQTRTNEVLSRELLLTLQEYCDEFLIHAADVEGKKAGMEADVITLLSQVPELVITYAGGIGSYEDIENFRRMSGGNLDLTIGSALSIYGGTLSLETILKM